jgi:hypothetical protein
MCIELEFYDTNDLLELKKWLNKNKLHYDYYDKDRKEYFKDEYSIVIYDLNEYDNNYRGLSFYIDFFNDDDKFCYIDIKQNKVANWKISLQ